MSTDRLPWHAGAVQSQQPSQRRLCRLVMHINNVQRAYRRCRKNRTNNCTLWVKKRYDYTLARDFAKLSDTDRSSNSFNVGVSSKFGTNASFKIQSYILNISLQYLVKYFALFDQQWPTTSVFAPRYNYTYSRLTCSCPDVLRAAGAWCMLWLRRTRRALYIARLWFSADSICSWQILTKSFVASDQSIRYRPTFRRYFYKFNLK